VNVETRWMMMVYYVSGGDGEKETRTELCREEWWKPTVYKMIVSTDAKWCRVEGLDCKRLRRDGQDCAGKIRRGLNGNHVNSCELI
jgi:hypothetical protein